MSVRRFSAESKAAACVSWSHAGPVKAGSLAPMTHFLTEVGGIFVLHVDTHTHTFTFFALGQPSTSDLGQRVLHVLM